MREFFRWFRTSQIITWVAFLLLVGILLFPIVISSLKNNVDEYTWIELKSSFIVCAYVLAAFLIIYGFARIHIDKVFWGYWTIVLIILFFIIGFIFISAEFGTKPFEFKLKVKNNISVEAGTIQCYNNIHKSILSNSRAQCSITLKGANSYYLDSVNMTLTNSLGQNSITNITNLTFISPNGKRKVHIDVIIISNENQTKYLETTHNYVFLNKDEDDKRRETYWTYVIGLLVAILFSVPSMMYNLKGLFNNEGERTMQARQNTFETQVLNSIDLEKIKTFKDLIMIMYKGFPNSRLKEDVIKRIIVTEADRKKLVEQGYFIEEHNWYGLGPNALNLVNSWNMEELNKQMKLLTLITLIITIIVAILTFMKG